jgi:hypothetical protein
MLNNFYHWEQMASPPKVAPKFREEAIDCHCKSATFSAFINIWNFMKKTISILLLSFSFVANAELFGLVQRDTTLLIHFSDAHLDQRDLKTALWEFLTTHEREVSPSLRLQYATTTINRDGTRVLRVPYFFKGHFPNANGVVLDDLQAFLQNRLPGATPENDLLTMVRHTLVTILPGGGVARTGAAENGEVAQLLHGIALIQVARETP